MSLYLDEIYRRHGKVGKLTDHKVGCGLAPSLPLPLSPIPTPPKALICSQSSLSLQREMIWNQVFKESRRWKLRRKIYFNWQYAQVGFGAFGSWFLNEETKCGRSKKFNTFDFFQKRSNSFVLSPITFINPLLRTSFLQNLWKTLCHITLPPGFIIKVKKHLSRGKYTPSPPPRVTSCICSQNIGCLLIKVPVHTAERVFCSSQSDY